MPLSPIQERLWNRAFEEVSECYADSLRNDRPWLARQYNMDALAATLLQARALLMNTVCLYAVGGLYPKDAIPDVCDALSKTIDTFREKYGRTIDFNHRPLKNLIEEALNECCEGK